MKLFIDTDKRLLTLGHDGRESDLPLYSKEAFEAVSDICLKLGWVQKYSYTFSWLGRPIIQLPEDMIRMQEIIFSVKPDVIIETGVAHGGSLIYYASLCKIADKGRVIGVDIEIRPHNREAIEKHQLFDLITLVEGSSTDPKIVNLVRNMVKPGETVLVMLDSCHNKQHVLDELEAYRDLVSTGSYIVATDGIMRDLHDAPRGETDWTWDNPAAAATEFAQKHREFVLVEPDWLFNESALDKRITYWPSAFLRRREN